MIEFIQPFLAPAVMFSAGGLLCLAQFARFTAIITLVRTFNRERLSALQEADRAEPEPTSRHNRSRSWTKSTVCSRSAAPTDRGSAQLWVTDMRNFAAMNEVWDAWIDPANPPVRAGLCSALAAPDYKVEIMVMAAT